MTDFTLPETPPLVSAVQARDLARLYKGMADHVRNADPGGASDAERRSAWWMAYSIALSQIPPGRVDDGGAP
jgi:hypothetical protein